MKISRKISDEKLLSLCEKFGRRALLWRRKFIGLLPEVNRRRLYERRGYGSIFEFASKLAGVSEAQVREVLNLEKRFTDKPALHTALVEGQVSVNKLARVASIATVENAGQLAEMSQLLSKSTLNTFVKGERQNGLLEPLFDSKSLSGQTFKLSEAVMEKLNRLQEQGQDVNAILLELLEGREEKIQEQKEKLAAEMKPTDSRYISVKIRRVLKEEFGKKCSIVACGRPAKEIHHTQRFSLARSHDPHYLAPLCREHHQLAHAIDVRVQECRRQGVS